METRSRRPGSPGGKPARDPLQGVERLLVDGTNLLYRLKPPRGGPGAVPSGSGPVSGGSGAVPSGSPPVPQAALIGRLRAVIPAQVRVEIVFDGAPEHRLTGVRIAHGLTVRHSGRGSADALLDRLVADVAGSGGTAEAAARAANAILVVTDDRELGRRISRRGGRVAGTSWLIARLERTRLGSPSPGRAQPPAPDVAEDESEGSGWQPGRGATRKTGNPRRRARMRR
jgi:YacP-like NYN domain